MKQAPSITSRIARPCAAPVKKGLTFPDRDFHFDSRASSVERRASSVERRASSVERRASSVERRVERRASSVERRASSVERRASSVERRASSVERRASRHEAVRAPRPRDHASPQSPPDRRLRRRASAAPGPSRPAFHVARAAIMLLLGIAALAVADFAQAQSDTTLVSNIDNAFRNHQSGSRFGQAFRTGDHAALLSNVKLRLGSVAAGSSLEVAIHESNTDDSHFGELLYTLSGTDVANDVVVGATNSTYDPPANVNAILKADTTYWVVLREADGIEVRPEVLQSG